MTVTVEFLLRLIGAVALYIPAAALFVASRYALLPRHQSAIRKMAWFCLIYGCLRTVAAVLDEIHLFGYPPVQYTVIITNLTLLWFAWWTARQAWLLWKADRERNSPSVIAFDEETKASTILTAIIDDLDTIRRNK